MAWGDFNGMNGDVNGNAITTTGQITQLTSSTWPCWQDGTNWYPREHLWSVGPTQCAGDVHVFPCPHCALCKCGQATVKRPKAKK